LKKKVGFHPLADIFPLMRGKAFDALVADISTSGLLYPILLFEDAVLDGRNRQRACEAAGVEPRYDTYEGDDPLGHMLALNVARRHLNNGSRQLAAARLADMPSNRPKGGQMAYLISQAEAAERLHVGERSVRRAKGILGADRRIIEAVEDGLISVPLAIEIIDLNLDESDLVMLLSLPSDDIPRNVARMQKTSRRNVVIERIQKEAGDAPAWPKGRYSVIYADPPATDDFGHTKKDVEHHYPTMSWDDIKALSVDEIATEDAALYLWASPHMVHKMLEVMARWGFEYRTHMIWDKERLGLGAWVRNQHEVLLIGRKGKFPPPPEDKRVGSVIAWEAGEHSAKPEIFAEMIELWYPTLTKVELFRRGPPRPGWEAWGFEALVEAL
jgi:N6-adenosine-specific RNA methylase IME4